jgi:hypothetical protein
MPPIQRGPSDRAWNVLLRDALERWPGLRMTVITLASRLPELEVASLQDAGVEVAFGQGDWETWLRGRRHHYGVIVVVDGASSLDAALSATQPLAYRATVGTDLMYSASQDRWRGLSRLAAAAGYA